MVTTRTSLAPVAVAAIIALSACSGNPGGGLAGISAPAQPSSARAMSGAHHDIPPNTCPAHTPRVWASDLGTNQVFGYALAGGAPCITLNGTEAPGGTYFNAPFYLATDALGQLYVADLNNDRVVRYTKKGVFAPLPTASQVYETDYGGQAFQPEGVCVTQKGILGVANRAYNNSGPTSVEVFNQSGTLIGFATNSGLTSAESCAFDKLGDLFLAGSTNNGQQIYYLNRGLITLTATLVNSGIPNTSYWISLYSRINGGGDDYYLSAGSPPSTCAPGPFCAPISTWKLSNTAAGNGPPPASGTIHFQPAPATPWLCTINGYPNNYDAVYQAAPQKGAGNASLFIADYANSSIEESGPASCPDNANGSQANPTIFAAPAAPVGVATYPTGQY
jgi:hypothetical protein